MSRLMPASTPQNASQIKDVHDRTSSWGQVAQSESWYKTMIKRTDKRMGLKPKYLAADTAYGTGKFLSWLIGAGITPYIPVWDMSQREDGTFSRADFTFDKEHNVYLCPAGKLLRQPARCLRAEPSSIVRAPETAAHVLSSLNVLLI
jgi:hypothetical protein